VVCGADQPDKYLHLLRDKKVALLVNQTSVTGQTHLVDTLLKSGIHITQIFAPEHGFRGTADAGERIKSGIDNRTGVKVTSMYGSSKKPSKESMQDVDVVVFDIQDVGARFYTYISSLQYMMEACAAFNVPLLILDRPNPNGFYVDGPVLETAHTSFVGMQPVPVVHGMTVGEYAQMLNGEKWLQGNAICQLTVIPCLNYDHTMTYDLPIPPSPNLKSLQAILWYPSLCFFEGTDVSVGRGTTTPFEIWGHPDFSECPYQFTPVSTPGATNPPHLNKVCYGENLHADIPSLLSTLNRKIQLAPLLKAYHLSKKGADFFTPFFTKLAGTEHLHRAIIAGKTEAEIRSAWQPQLDAFKITRRKYLLYPDFE
jgi:uncharacterized protein YbbC (DUF1343 family)